MSQAVRLKTMTVPDQSNQPYVIRGLTAEEEQDFLFGGAKIHTVNGTITNVSGSYSGVIADNMVAAGMKPVGLELGTPSVFRGKITVTPGAGFVTVSCPEVVGTSTIKIAILKSVDDPTSVSSTEFDLLDNYKANKVTSATSGHLAALNSNGDLTDSGHAANDFATIDELGVVVTGKQTPLGADKDQFVIVRNSTITNISDGLYKATKTIPVNTDIDDTYLTTNGVSKGAANSLKNEIGDVPSGKTLQEEIDDVNGKITSQAFDTAISVSDLHATKASLGCTSRTIRYYPNTASNKPSNEAGTVEYLYNSATTNWGVAIAHTQSSKVFVASISGDSFGTWKPLAVIESKTINGTTDNTGNVAADLTGTLKSALFVPDSNSYDGLYLVFKSIVGWWYIHASQWSGAAATGVTVKGTLYYAQ